MRFKRGYLMMVMMLSIVLLVACSSTDNAITIGTDGENSGESGNKIKELEIVRGYHASLEQFQGSDDINNNKIMDLLREWSGYDLHYGTLPKDNAMQRVSVLLASGDVPDLLWIPGKADYFRLAQQGTFEPLDDLVEEYMPNLEKVFSQEELDAARYDGKLYAIPVRVAQKVGQGLLVRSDMLEDLGIEDPTTLDDLYMAMQMIRNEKGIAPLTGAASNPGGFIGSFTPIAGAFGVDTTTIVKDGELEFSWLQPDYKEFLSTMKKWYDEGLIDQEFAINTATLDKMITGNAALATTYWADAQRIDYSLMDREDGGTIRYLPPPVGKDGQSGTPEQALATTYQVIPKQAKNKEGAADYINFFFSEEADILVTYGIEGEDYTVEDGEIVQTPEQSDAIPWRTLYMLSDTDPSFFARLEAKGFLPYYQPLEEFKQNREETVYAPSIEKWDEHFTDLRNFAEENAIQFIMGRRNLSEFDQFVEEFNARGGTVAIEAMNEWFTSQ